MSLVWHDESLGATDKIVMLSLADHADDEGYCYPSIARLTRRTGLTARTVQNVTKRLQETGRLSIELNAGRSGSNLYRVTPSPAANAPRSKCTHAGNNTPPASSASPSALVRASSPPTHPPNLQALPISWLGKAAFANSPAARFQPPGKSSLCGLRIAPALAKMSGVALGWEYLRFLTNFGATSRTRFLHV